MSLYFSNLLASNINTKNNITSIPWGSSGIQSNFFNNTYTMTGTSSNETNINFNTYLRPILSATNNNIITTNSSTIYIENSPTIFLNGTGGQTSLSNGNNTDSTNGYIYIANGLSLSNFVGKNLNSISVFFGLNVSRSWIPIILELSSGNNYTLRGIGTTRTETTAGIKNYNFDLISGSNLIANNNYYFGWKDNGIGFLSYGVGTSFSIRDTNATTSLPSIGNNINFSRDLGSRSYQFILYFNSTLSISKPLSLCVSTGDTKFNNIILYNNTGGGRINLIANSAGNNEFTFPNNTSNLFDILTSDGNGNIYWDKPYNNIINYNESMLCTSYNGVGNNGSIISNIYKGMTGESYDLTNVNLNAKGFGSSAFDGRYIYMVSSTLLLKYDTVNIFNNLSSYQSYSISTINTKFCVYDGVYVYFLQNNTNILRYDTKKNFNNNNSYTSYNLTNVDNTLISFNNGIFDGRYIYFLPTSYKCVRYDTTNTFDNISSYSVFDFSILSPLNTLYNYNGASYDGRYIYFSPYTSSTPSYIGNLIRYDTTQSFILSNSYSVFNLTSLNNNAVGFIGSIFDGNYIYLIPNYNGTNVSGIFVRYNTQLPFNNTTSYEIIDLTTLNTIYRGFNGATFDGKYIYLIPNHPFTGGTYGVLVKYDITSSFRSSISYSFLNLLAYSSNAGCYSSSIYDGKYVYLIPQFVSPVSFTTQGIFMRIPAYQGPAINSVINYDKININNNLIVNDRIVQKDNKIYIGTGAGAINQSQLSIAIGYQSGYENQATGSIAIGYQAGYINQATGSIAIGYQAGYSGQQQYAIAIGYQTAYSGQQKEYSIGVGYQAAYTNQGSNAIAIGYQSGYNSQKDDSIAIGYQSAYSTQGNSSIAIGYQSGFINQNDNSIAIGNQAGYNNQSIFNIAVGNQAGYNNQNYNSIAIGYQAGYTDQRNFCTAIGYQAGYINQGTGSIAIGYQAGSIGQNTGSIAIGYQAGLTGQGINSIAVGYQCGFNRQNNNSIAIGFQAGFTGQGNNSIAIGNKTAYSNQRSDSIAIGFQNSLFNISSNQNTGSISIGSNSGLNNQSFYAIAIGTNTAINYQQSNSIIIGKNTTDLYLSNNSISVGNVNNNYPNDYLFYTNFDNGNTDGISGNIIYSTITPNGTGFSYNANTATGLIKTLYITIPEVSFCSSFYKNGTNSDIRTILAFMPSYNSYGICVYNDYLAYTWNTNYNAVPYNTNLLLSDNTWYHIVLTVSSTQANIYLNGSLYYTNNISHTSFTSTSGRMAIGYHFWWGRTFGNLDNVSIYNRILTSQEVRLIYNNTLQQKSSNKIDNNSIFIGCSTGTFIQNSNSLAIGTYNNLQQDNSSISIGVNSANDQRFASISIGQAITSSTGIQGTGSISFGYQAGYINQNQNSIIFNASSSLGLDSYTGGFFVNPIVNSPQNNNILVYDNTNKEILYDYTYNNYTGPTGDFNYNNIYLSNNILSLNASNYSNTGILTNFISNITNTSSSNFNYSFINSFRTPNLNTNQSNTIFTNSSTLYIQGPPNTGSNTFITNPYSLYINTGSNYFGDKLSINKTLLCNGISYNISTISSNTTLQNHLIIIIDATSNNVTLTLPSASSNNGKIYYITRSDNTANTATISISGIDNLNGTVNSITLSQYTIYTLLSFGNNNWFTL